MDNNLRVNIKGFDGDGEGGVTYTNEIVGRDIDYKQLTLDVTVSADNVNDNDGWNDFDVTCDSTWVDIKRVRNKLTVTVAQNNTKLERSASIDFKHKLDADAYVGLCLWQGVCDYKISVRISDEHTSDYPNYHQFDTWLDKGDVSKVDGKEVMQNFMIVVTTENGIRDFGVGPIIEYGRYVTQETGRLQYKDNDKYEPGERILKGERFWYYCSGNDVTYVDYIYPCTYQLRTATENITVPNDATKQYFRVTNDRLIPYDHGLKLEKIDNSHLRVTTYGQTCLYDDYYYILTMYHMNNPKSMAQVRIDFYNGVNETANGLSFL